MFSTPFCTIFRYNLWFWCSRLYSLDSSFDHLYSKVSLVPKDHFELLLIQKFRMLVELCSLPSMATCTISTIFLVFWRNDSHRWTETDGLDIEKLSL